MKRFMYMVSAMALMVGLMAPAANADIGIDTAVIVFQGTATVCAQTVPGKPVAAGCPIKVGENQGLYLPGQGSGPNNEAGIRNPGASDKWVQRTGNYSFATSPGPVPCTAFTATNATLVKACSISVAGKLAPVAGIGAACGMTHGYGGVGVATVGVSFYSLSNVGWPVAGAILPITGTYDFIGTTDPAKDKGPLNGKRIGPIVGVLVAQGGAACLKSNVTGKAGASTFNIVGVVDML